jgi:hypothetical protein
MREKRGRSNEVRKSTEENYFDLEGGRIVPRSLHSAPAENRRHTGRDDKHVWRVDRVSGVLSGWSPQSDGLEMSELKFRCPEKNLTDLEIGTTKAKAMDNEMGKWERGGIAPADGNAAAEDVGELVGKGLSRAGVSEPGRQDVTGLIC